MKILILKPSSLGDVVQALPVLRLIKRHLPESEVYWWVERTLAPLLEGDPDLAGVVPFNRREWSTPGAWLRHWKSLLWMRAQRFDWVIDLQCLARSGTVAWLANGKLTIGLDEPREGARGFYDIVARRPTFHTHAVDWYLGVLPLLGIPLTWNFKWLPSREKIAAEIRQRWALNGSPWVVLQPGARWMNKRWPVEHFAELGRVLARSHPRLRVAVLGGQEDQPLARQIVESAGDRCLDLTGRISLPEMVEWIRFSNLVVSNDTGPMHVAAALGKPVVAMFGPTEARRTGPYGQVGRVLKTRLACSPCFKSRCRHNPELECLRAISPGDVYREVTRRLSPAVLRG